ncbi:MAG: MBL fold metallo-hydrolase [Succinivibrio sp.]
MKFEQIRNATSIITYQGVRFLVDPMLADKYAYPIVPTTINCAPGNPTTDLPCSLDHLFDVDALLVTHLHFDHFDEVAKNATPKDLPVIVPGATEELFMKKIGFKTVINAEHTAVFNDISISITPCEHGDSDPVVNRIFKDKGTNGIAHGFILSGHREKGVFYLAGDTILNKDVFEVIEEYRPYVIAVNAACAQMSPGHSIMMGLDDIRVLCRAKKDISIVATHLDGVSHATISSQMLRDYSKLEKLDNLYVPAKLETLEF